MKVSTTLSLINFFCIFSILSTAQNETGLFDLTESVVVINGSSNVIDYSCDLIDLSNNKNISMSSNMEYSRQKVRLVGASIQLKISEFDCHSRLMNKNLIKALKESEYPYIRISLLEFNFLKMHSIPFSQNEVSSKLSITIAGVTNNYDLVLDSIYISDNRITMVGDEEFKMSEFKVIPPVALFGLIKTDNLVNIDFNLNFIRRE